MSTHSTAVLDTDFLQRMLEITKTNPCDLLQEVFEKLGQRPLVHSLVNEKELLLVKTKVDELVSRGLLTIQPCPECLCEPDDIYYYGRVADELYKRHKLVSIYTLVPDLFTDWVFEASLGEVHSLALCAVFGYGFFYSDDNDVKPLVQHARDFLPDLRVENRNDLYQTLGEAGMPKKKRRPIKFKPPHEYHEK